MDTQILKLEPPFEYIHCNGSTALHIATMIVYEAKTNGNGEYELITHSHPIVKYFNTPGGTVWNRAELRDCEVVCSQADMQLSLKRFRTILSHHPHNEQNDEEGTWLHPIWKRDLEDIGIKVAWPVGEDGKEHFQEFEVKLDIKPDKTGGFVCQDHFSDFSFYEEVADEDGLRRRLIQSRDFYYSIFDEHDFSIVFTCADARYANIINDINNSKK